MKRSTTTHQPHTHTHTATRSTQGLTHRHVRSSCSHQRPNSVFLFLLLVLRQLLFVLCCLVHVPLPPSRSCELGLLLSCDGREGDHQRVSSGINLRRGNVGATRDGQEIERTLRRSVMSVPGRGSLPSEGQASRGHLQSGTSTGDKTSQPCHNVMKGVACMQSYHHRS